MADNNRSRKLAPHYKQETVWKPKQPAKKRLLKYSREQVLQAYKDCQPPEILISEILQTIYSSKSLPPLQTPNTSFPNGLGEDLNSRKPVPRERKSEQLPEWYSEETPPALEIIPPKPAVIEEPKQESPTRVENAGEVIILVNKGKVKNLTEKLEECEFKENEFEEYSKVDVEVEEKLKNLLDESEEVPDWDDPDPIDLVMKEEAPVIVEVEEEPVPEQPKEESKEEEAPKVPIAPVAPSYDKTLLDYHLAIGNPFATTLISFGILDENNRYFYPPDSKPFEKIWYYKDQEAKTQGPFSTIMMFNWTINGFFPPDLEIGIGNTGFFVPMNLFNSLPPLPEPVVYTRNWNQNQNRNHNRAKTLDENEKGDKRPDNRNKRYSNAGYKQKDEAATENLKNLLGLSRENNPKNDGRGKRGKN